ncbi:PEP-CTERM sorting domain-containing protein [Duganella sp. HSC-15S17]|nr:PEP-CTERM sorting domain-containing protein [Duganella violaceicalia]
MKLTLTDDTTGQLLISRSYNAGFSGSGVDSRFAKEGNLFYTPSWQVEQLSIDQSLSGHSFTLSLLAADCQPTGHTGYAYLDGFGAVTPSVPEPTTYGMLLAGLGLLGYMARRKKSA